MWVSYSWRSLDDQACTRRGVSNLTESKSIRGSDAVVDMSSKVAVVVLESIKRVSMG